MYAAEYFALGGAEQSLTSQGVFPTGCHRVGLAVLTPQCSLPGCHEVGHPGERGAGWVGWTGAAEPEPSEKDNNSGSQKHKSSPCLPVG